MDFVEIEKWIRLNILKNGYISFENFSKGTKLIEVYFSDINNDRSKEGLEKINTFLRKVAKKLVKQKEIEFNWCKINIIDNAVPELVGIGLIRNLYDLELLSDLITKDTADQSGDTIVGLFGAKRDWLLKITNNQEGDRIYAKIYGKERVVEKIKEVNHKY